MGVIHVTHLVNFIIVYTNFLISSSWMLGVIQTTSRIQGNTQELYRIGRCPADANDFASVGPEIQKAIGRYSVDGMQLTGSLMCAWY